MDVAVQKAGSQVLAVGVDDLRAFADAVAGVAYQGDAPGGYGLCA